MVRILFFLVCFEPFEDGGILKVKVQLLQFWNALPENILEDEVDEVWMHCKPLFQYTPYFLLYCYPQKIENLP